MFFRGNDIRQVKQLIRQGELQQACQIIQQHKLVSTPQGRRIVSTLIDRLVDRAGRSSISGRLEKAWSDLSDASRIAVAQHIDRLAREKNQLVERTVDVAQSQLISGKFKNAYATVQLLQRRKIQDRRAIQLQQVCKKIELAEQLASAGRMNEATSILQETHQVRPDLCYLGKRINELNQQRVQLQQLTDHLQIRITESAWSGANEVSSQILQIAPTNQVALDAIKRCERKNIHLDKLVVSEPENPLSDVRVQPNANEVQFVGESEAKSTSVPNPKNNNLTTHDSAIHGSDNLEAGNPEAVNPNEPILMTGSDAKQISGKPGSDSRTFMLWIDGVGGFLVCTGKRVTIGRAVSGSRIDIPVQADIRRHHLQIKRSEERYIARFLDGVPEQKPDQSSAAIFASAAASKGVAPEDEGHDWKLLSDQQQLDLGQGVRIKFRVSHPLGRSARVEFTSRHRTEPWSDAVILLGDAFLMGPDRSNHIVCPRWTSNIVVFRRDNEVVMRIPTGSFEVADSNDLQLSETDSDQTAQNGVGEVVLRDGLQITNDELSISCEEVL